MQKPIWEMTRDLSKVAMGVTKADTIIKNVTLVNVNTAELQKNIDIAIYGGYIALVGEASHTIGENTKIVDGSSKFATPGFMDGHIHVESSMMTVREYAKTILPLGTTAIFPDPHEIANVFGEKGVEFMIDDAKNTCLKVFTTMPSCVPAVEAFEDNGAKLNSDCIKKFMQNDDIYGLGEMMNFPAVLNADEEIHNELKHTLKANKIVTGHYSMPETNEGLNAYIASGVRCCHESVRKEDALAKIRRGMYVQVREGSAWHDLKEVIKAVTEQNIDTRFVTLVSDDTHPDTLITLGHMDHIVRRAIEEGVDPVKAIQMVTINVANCFQLDREYGSISPGKVADILLLSDLSKVLVDEVFVNGEKISEKGKLIKEISNSDYPKWLYNSVKIWEDPQRKACAEDFYIKAPAELKTDSKVRVIEIIEAKVGTIERHETLPIEENIIKADLSKDIAYVAVLERHKATGTRGLGFVKGFKLKSGAVASTVSHDAHNVLVVGTNHADMALAVNKLIETGGGMVACENGEILASLALPIAGIMSDKSVMPIAHDVVNLDKAWKQLGCDLVSPFMTMALLALGVLPEIRITNRGLIDCVDYKFTTLVV